jgi:hypothetical protein
VPGDSYSKKGTRFALPFDMRFIQRFLCHISAHRYLSIHILVHEMLTFHDVCIHSSFPKKQLLWRTHNYFIPFSLYFIFLIFIVLFQWLTDDSNYWQDELNIHNSNDFILTRHEPGYIWGTVGCWKSTAHTVKYYKLLRNLVCVYSRYGFYVQYIHRCSEWMKFYVGRWAIIRPLSFLHSLN